MKVLTKAAYPSYHHRHPLPSFPLMCMLCVCSDINIIIVYTTILSISEENRGFSMQQPIIATSHNPLVADLILPPPLWCGIKEGFNHEVVLPSNPFIIFSKDIEFAVSRPFYIHVITINKGSWYVSSKPLFIIHVCHTRWSLHQIYIIQISVTDQ